MKLLYSLFLLTFLMIFCSCEEEHKQCGYPSSLIFPFDGGEKIISGNVSIFGVLFEDKGGETCGMTDVCENDTIVVSYEWIKVKYVYGDTMMKIIAEPSENNKKRSLIVRGQYPPKYCEIKVLQFE